MESTYNRYLGITERFSRIKVGVLGDFMLDVYMYGKPTRISREAPVLIVVHESEQIFPGGAGNTLKNLSALKANVIPVGLIGSDDRGKDLLGVIEKLGIDTKYLLPSLNTTITKTRFWAGDTNTTKHQVLRYDREPQGSIPENILQKFNKIIEECAREVDAWVVSDYGYETVHPDLWKTLVASGVPVVADSRYNIDNLYGATLITPNEEEALSTMHKKKGSKDDLLCVGNYLRSRLGCKAVLITRGNQGMLLIQEGVSPDWIPICGTDEIVDVTGAGDTVSAVMTICLAAHASFQDAARLANFAASVVVMKRGTATCDQKELISVIERERLKGNI